MQRSKAFMIAVLRLQALPGVGAKTARKIIAHYGSAHAFFESPRDSSIVLSVKESKTPSDYLHALYLKLATDEFDFILANKIQTFYFEDANYPYFLSLASDAPVLLLGKGHLDTGPKKIIAVVGTRKMTGMGREFCEQFIEEIKPLDPVIVSGFAKGIDITIQRAAAEQGLQTIGCLAHGFKRIYPAQNRPYIKDVMEQGGFYTEFFSGMHALPGHFVSRNRIIAGLSQATLVVESAKKGGALHTAQLANSYDRPVFAVPGRTTDFFSVGCNDLIKHLKAQMLTHSRDLINSMNWQDQPGIVLNMGLTCGTELETKDKATNHTAEESVLYQCLFSNGKMHVDQLASLLNWEIKVLYPCLMTLELKGGVRHLPGQFYEAI